MDIAHHPRKAGPEVSATMRNFAVQISSATIAGKQESEGMTPTPCLLSRKVKTGSVRKSENQTGNKVTANIERKKGL
jgi:hypothetical protein